MDATAGLFDDDFKKSFDKYFPYLMEIRKRLLFIAALFLISGIVGFFYYEKVIRLILSIYNLEGVNIVFTSPFQFMSLAVSCGLSIGLIVIFPVIIYQLISFLRPALRPKEFRVFLQLIPISLVLFAIGFGIGSLMMRYVVIIFYERSQALDIGNYLDISSLLSQIVITAAAMGLAFQFPIVLTVLMKLRILSYKMVASQRMLAYAASIFFAALLPPTDILSLLALTAPLIVLYELTLLFNRGLAKKRRK